MKCQYSGISFSKTRPFSVEDITLTHLQDSVQLKVGDSIKEVLMSGLISGVMIAPPLPVPMQIWLTEVELK